MNIEKIISRVINSAKEQVDANIADLLSAPSTKRWELMQEHARNAFSMTKLAGTQRACSRFMLAGFFMAEGDLDQMRAKTHEFMETQLRAEYLSKADDPKLQKLMTLVGAIAEIEGMQG